MSKFLNNDVILDEVRDLIYDKDVSQIAVVAVHNGGAHAYVTISRSPNTKPLLAAMERAAIATREVNVNNNQ